MLYTNTYERLLAHSTGGIELDVRLLVGKKRPKRPDSKADVRAVYVPITGYGAVDTTAQAGRTGGQIPATGTVRYATAGRGKQQRARRVDIAPAIVYNLV